MATTPSDLTSERITQSFKDLAASAAQLNAASDELAKAISPIDVALRKMNVGIEVWYSYSSFEDEDGDYWTRLIGYAKVGGKWGLALSVVSGNSNEPDDELDEEWLFNDAPREMRIEALDYIQVFLDTLVARVTTAAADLKKKTEQARKLATMISAVAADIPEGK
jgi:hypothetical protein